MTKRANRTLYLLITLLNVLGLSSCQTTEPKSDPCAYRPEYISQTQQQAETGDAEAQFSVAVWYQHGGCLAQDDSKAADWYQRAAEGGYAKAQFEIGEMYSDGIGVTKDVEKAEKWYRKAADQGDAKSQVRLADFYRTVVKDTDKAVPWYRKAAEQGHIEAIRTLGYMYLEGKGVEKDLDEAEKWYRLAYERDDWLAWSKLERVMKEKAPEAWERELQALEAERQRKIEEQEERERVQREEEVRQAAKQANTRFRSVSFAVRENEKSKRIRAGARWKLGRLKEPKGSTSDSDEFLEISLVSTLYGAPGPLVAVMYYGFEGIKKAVKTQEEKAKIRPGLGILIKTFSHENIEQDFREELLATATRQQAPNLLVADSGDTVISSPHHLDIQLEELRMITVPPNWHIARMWATTEVTLTNRKGDTAFKKRFCYGSPSFSIEEVAEDALEFKENLNNVYRGLSSQILSEGLGLAADDNAPKAWWNTTKMCSFTGPAIRVVQGYYKGEMKDGKPHGYGEIRFKRGFYYGSIYRGSFVNGKANGTGRCKSRGGSWWSCTFVDGKRL